MKLHLKRLTALMLIILSLVLTACGDIVAPLAEPDQPVQSFQPSAPAPQSEPPRQEGEIKIHFIDVGQGDCALLQLPNARTMLIDAGTSKAGDDIISYLDSLGITRLDYLVATHPHADHIGSMASVVRQYDIGKVYMPRAQTNTRTYERLLTALQDKGLKVTAAKAGVVVEDEGELKISFLSPTRDSYDDLNNYSAVMKIQYKQTAFLFTGDAEREVEQELLREDLSADVLKVGHHGSSTSSHKSFINAVNPSVAVISVGADNEYGHPTAKTLENLQSARVYRTDLDGTVIVASDGASLTVTTEKGN